MPLAGDERFTEYLKRESNSLTMVCLLTITTREATKKLIASRDQTYFWVVIKLRDLIVQHSKEVPKNLGKQSFTKFVTRIWVIQLINHYTRWNPVLTTEAVINEGIFN